MSANTELDYISICGNASNGQCGYCKGISTKKSSYGIVCDNMKPDTYYHMMNRGWRRCGTYFYKPLNDTTCCPSYTIRCDTKKFQLSKSQRKLLKNLRKFLTYGKESIKNSKHVNIDARGDEVSSFYSPGKGIPEKSIVQSCGKNSNTSKKSKKIRYNLKLEKLKCQAEQQKKPFEEIFSSYQTRRNNRLDKNRPKRLSEYIDFSDIKQPKHRLEIRTVCCHPESERFVATKSIEHELYSKYQCAIHGDSADEVDMKQFKRFLIAGGLQSSGYHSIDDQSINRRSLPLGQFHQQYWLDGNRLIAVGVIDVVPQAVSSVYLFYDPDFAFLGLGTLSALFEVDFVDRWSRAFDQPELRYYYMGFYIHACRKMRYKAQLAASSLLCPVSFHWVPVAQCQSILDSHKFSRFAPPDARDELSLDNRSIQQLSTTIEVIVAGKSYKLKRYLGRLSAEFVSLIEQFARLVGGGLVSSLRIVLA